MRASAILTLAVVGILVGGIAATARAGEAVKLAIEFPPDVRSLEPGAELNVVQVVGFDADGARVGFGGRRARLTVTAGSVRSVKPPYQFAYTAPTTIDGPTAITFTAVLDGAPAVRGSTRLDVLPKGPYVRLRVSPSDNRVDWGKSTTVAVQGEDRTGRLVPVVTSTVQLSVEGPGHIEFVRLGTYRFTAPDAPDPEGRSQSRLIARLEENKAVHGHVSIDLGGRGVRLPRLPPVRRPADTEKPADEPAEKLADTSTAGSGGRSDEKGDTPAPDTSASKTSSPSTEGVDPITSGGAKPGTTTPPTAGTAKDAERSEKRAADQQKSDREKTPRAKQELIWPGGRLQITAWRAKPNDDEGTTMRRVRHLPEPGAEFALRDVLQRIRAIVLDADVTKVDAEWRAGTTETPLGTPLETPPGTLRTTRNKADQLVVIVEARPPANGDVLRITLVLRKPTGDLRDEWVLRRKQVKPK